MTTSWSCRSPCISAAPSIAALEATTLFAKLSGRVGTPSPSQTVLAAARLWLTSPGVAIVLSSWERAMIRFRFSHASSFAGYRPLRLNCKKAAVRSAQFRGAKRAGYQSIARQGEFGAQAADRSGVERERAVIKTCELDHDGKSKTRARLGFVQPPSARRHLFAVSRRKTGAIIVNDNAYVSLLCVVATFDFLSFCVGGRMIGHHLDSDPRVRPLTAIVDQVTNHLLKILLLAAEVGVLRDVHRDGDIALTVNLLHGTRERRHHGANVGQRADDGRAGSKTCALKLTRHLIAHDVGLLADLLCERIVASCRRLVDDDG